MSILAVIGCLQVNLIKEQSYIIVPVEIGTTFRIYISHKMSKVARGTFVLIKSFSVPLFFSSLLFLLTFCDFLGPKSKFEEELFQAEKHISSNERDSEFEICIEQNFRKESNFSKVIGWTKTADLEENMPTYNTLLIEI